MEKAVAFKEIGAKNDMDETVEKILALAKKQHNYEEVC